MRRDCPAPVSMLVAILTVYQLLEYRVQLGACYEAISVDSKHHDFSDDFCHVNNFSDSSGFHTLHAIHVSDLNWTFILDKVNTGSPFVVSGITEKWIAVEKWNHSFFKSLFQKEQLFSSTFSTVKSPKFCEEGSRECEDEFVYFGVFLNNPHISKSLNEDYLYPDFIPDDWWVRGNEWVHWGNPPCGAKRHMDLTCTSRVSVQVTGFKEWRLFPVTDTGVSTAWEKMLQPYSVKLRPGDALFWFPGWEHETKIVTGPSVSLSLHFVSPRGTRYQETFKTLLKQRVSSDCEW